MKILCFLLALIFLFSRSAGATSYRIAFLGDSWTAGVGVVTSCVQPTMASATCSGGQSIADVTALILGASAYQNLALGGSSMYDVITNEVAFIDSSANVVVVNIGINDERPIGDTHDLWVYWSLCNAATRTYFPVTTGNSSCGFNEPYNASTYNANGFRESPPYLFSYMTQIVSMIKQRAPTAAIYLVLPGRGYENPMNSFGATQIADYEWSAGLIINAIQAQAANVRGIIDLGNQMSYASSNFVPNGTCPTSGISDCGGHPNVTGAAGIAAIIAAGI